MAIGRDGQNVRLAHKLTNWKIDIKSETQAKLAEKEEELSLKEADSDEIFEDINIDQEESIDEQISEELSQESYSLDEEDIESTSEITEGEEA